MCLSCGCGFADSDHGDERNITLSDLRDAADAADVTVPQAIANMVHGVAHWRGRRKQAPVEKAEEGIAGFQVVKSSDERRFTLGVAYPANRPDVGKAQDGFRDFVGPQALQDAAWSYLRKGGGVGVQHRDGTEGRGVVVESYLWPGDTWHMKAADGSDQTIEPGDWLLGVVWDEPTWAAIKSGELNGLSPQGRARRRIPSAEALANLRS